MHLDLDNIICLVLLGAIALVSLIMPTENVTLASSISSGLVGYLAKSMASLGDKRSK